MPNQRDIARAAGVTQAAVSMALRGDPSIPEETRRRIHAAAEAVGYRPNAYVSTLMAHIRSGRQPRDKGCIAIVSDAKNESDWLWGDTTLMQYAGIVERARQTGFHTECFYTDGNAALAAKIDRILYARGITGMILATPRKYQQVDLGPAFQWSRYAIATIAYSWTTPAVDRVASHHKHSVETVFAQLALRGYKRPGMILPANAVEGVDSNWLAGYLVCQYRLPAAVRIPLHVGRPGSTTVSAFKSWLRKWKPDVLICLVGHEQEWLDQLGLRAPDDIGLVCLNRPTDSRFSGIEERHETIGAAVLDIVAARIQHNEYGLPAQPKLILINGVWSDGETLRGAHT